MLKPFILASKAHIVCKMKRTAKSCRWFNPSLITLDLFPIEFKPRAAFEDKTVICQMPPKKILIKTAAHNDRFSLSACIYTVD